MRDSRLDLTRSIAETPLREHHTSDGASRALSPRYWRQHHRLGDHNARGLLDGGPDEFSGNLQQYIADSMWGAPVESPRAALNRMKLRRINARRKAAERRAFVSAAMVASPRRSAVRG